MEHCDLKNKVTLDVLQGLLFGPTEVASRVPVIFGHMAVGQNLRYLFGDEETLPR